MGCLTVKARRIGEGLDAQASRVGSGLQVSCGLVCSVNKADRILWAKDGLVWFNPEVGIVKYNHLTATGDWSLSEITIEELL